MKINIDNKFCLLCSLVFLVLQSCKEKTTEKAKIFEKPNIVFITTDYTRGVDLPAMGASFLKAPAIEKLGKEGAVFSKHNCITPVCSPARASIATSLYAHDHGLWDNQGLSIKKPEWPFLMRELQAAGYTTAGIGKMHFHPFKADYNFDIRISLEGKDRDYRDDDYEAYLVKNGTSRKAIREKDIGTDLPSGQAFYPWHVDEILHPDYFVGEKSVETIKNGALTQDKPWFMWVSFTGPHNPWNPPKRYFDLYKDVEVPTGHFVEGELKNKPIDYTRHRYGYGGNLMNIYDTIQSPEAKEAFRRDLRIGHYASLSFVDEQINRVLQQLKEQNLLKNTIVIFTSDHGSALFDNEMMHKGSPFPTQSLVPMVVWAPEYIEAGIREGFTSHVDIYPTLLELAGGEIHPKAAGKSFVSMLNSKNEKIHDFTVIESALVTSLMADDWLIGFSHISKQIELYDLNKDPMCHYNVANIESNKSVIQKLQNMLVNWRREQSPELEVGGNPLYWTMDVLGNEESTTRLWNSYVRAYKRLTKIDEKKPGVVGQSAIEVLKNIAQDDLEGINMGTNMNELH
ncbi:sulfatase-like hydrolase/transferase [Seonamhaeicola sp.]|uniref:sulfatase family protein n=1 Tax=Seonamhaeicola sp. TaxID=1912245 RepID=UPI002637B5C0|nr:sulfatase-like hydrolase/transferase [Seonamhaeicola sp.]